MAEMSKESLIRGPPEVIFSFNDDEEIVLKVEESIIKGWEVLLFQPCKVKDLVIGVIFLYFIDTTKRCQFVFI